MDYDELFPGRFLKSGEFKGKAWTLTITKIHTEELPQDKGGTKVRGIVAFRETTKALVLNRTNGECLKGMWGRDASKWIGKRVTLYPAPWKDNFTGEQTTAIRVKGSPDIEHDMEIEIRLPRKSPVRVKMLKTGGTPAQRGQPNKTAQAARPASTPPPPADNEPPMPDEPPPDVVLPGQDGYAPGDLS